MKQSSPKLSYYSSIPLDVQKETARNCTEGSQCPEQDLNHMSPKYKSELLPVFVMSVSLYNVHE
jgi:hypothetical protein